MSARASFVLSLLPCTAAVASAAEGREVFAAHCVPCHGADGKARTPAGKKLGARDLSESRIPDAEIARQILDGVRDAKAAHRMPPFRDKLSNQEVAALVSFVKTFRR